MSVRPLNQTICNVPNNATENTLPNRRRESIETTGYESEWRSGSVKTLRQFCSAFVIVITTSPRIHIYVFSTRLQINVCVIGAPTSGHAPVLMREYERPGVGSGFGSFKWQHRLKLK